MLNISMTSAERGRIPGLFLDKCNIATALIQDGITKKTSFSPEEIKLGKGIPQPNGGVFLPEADKIPEKEMEFADTEITFLQDRINFLDKTNSLDANFISGILKIRGINAK